MVRSLYRARFAALAGIALVCSVVSVASTATAAPVADDTPVLLTPKGEHETGAEEKTGTRPD